MPFGETAFHVSMPFATDTATLLIVGPTRSNVPVHCVVAGVPAESVALITKLWLPAARFNPATPRNSWRGRAADGFGNRHRLAVHENVVEAMPSLASTVQVTVGFVPETAAPRRKSPAPP